MNLFRDKKPDYCIEGQIFDNVAPATNNPRNVADRILRKVEAGQTERLKEAVVIDKNGNVLHNYL